MTMLHAAAALALALALDGWLGEARRWHPLVGFGRAASVLEKILNRGERRIARGLLAWCLLLVPLLSVAIVLQLACNRLPLPWAIAVQAVCVYIAVGMKSLGDHARAILHSLEAEDVPQARRALSMIVSRDTSALSRTEVSRAGIESVLENGSDAVIASLFWFTVAGIPGVVLHRAANTLDAMWGYRNERFNEFGRTSARIDDVLNFIPARITALLYALLGNAGAALRCWRAQARVWSSPNAGPVMAAGAGALDVCLGGAAIYGGELEQRPQLGCGRAPQPGDIARAIRLVTRSALLFVAIVGALGLLL